MTDSGRRGTLTFPEEPASWHAQRQSVCFPAQDGARRVQCFVTRPLLCALEGARSLSAVECLHAFRRHRSRIHAMAARRFAALAPRDVAEIFVRIGDLR
jgi:hypothetical protein